MATNDLTSIARVKDFLKLAVTTDDGLLQALVTRLSLWTLGALSRDIVATDYDWRTSGRGKNIITLPQYPIISLTGIYIGAYGTTPPVLASTESWIDGERTIVLPNRCFDKGVGNVRIVYRAGYEVIPEDLDEAVAELVAFAYKERDHWGQTSKTVGDQTIAYITKSAPPRILDSINWWMNVVPVK